MASPDPSPPSAFLLHMPALASTPSSVFQSWLGAGPGTSQLLRLPSPAYASPLLCELIGAPRQ